MSTISKILDSLPTKDSSWCNGIYRYGQALHWGVTVNLENLHYKYFEEHDFHFNNTASPNIDKLPHFVTFGVRRPLLKNPWHTAEQFEDEKEKEWNAHFLPSIYFTHSLEDALIEVNKRPIEFAVAYDYRTDEAVVLVENNNLDGNLFSQVNWNYLQGEIEKRRLALYIGECRNKQFDTEIDCDDEAA